MAGLMLSIISPQKEVLQMECLGVTMPTTEGQITVLPKHMAIFSTLTAGEVKVKNMNGEETSLAVGGGFVNVKEDRVVVLVEFGIKSDEIDEEKVRQAKKRAEEILKSQADERGSALAQASLARSLLELKMVQKRRKIS